MKSLDLIQILHQARNLSNKEEVIAFEDALEALRGRSNDFPYESLYNVFIDDTHQSEVMWNLVHFIEDLDLKKTLSAFINVIDKMVKEGKEWSKVFMYGILNHQESLELFLKLFEMDRKKKNKEIIYALLKEMKVESPNLQEKIDRLLPEN